MTDRSSEERSRFEKWATREDVDIGIGKDAAGNYYARVTAKAWLSWRAALEDRQEAAPICQFCHVEMKHQPSCLVDEPVFTCDNPSCKAPQYVSGVPSEAKNDRQEAAPDVTRCENCEAEIFFDTTSDEWYHTERPRTTPSCGNPMPGVPSEADTAKFDRAEKEVARGEVHKLSELSGVPSQSAPLKDASNTTAEELEAWNQYGQYWWRNGYNSGLEHGGFPSEATPSKENAPPNDEDRAKFLVMSLDLHKHGMGRDFGDAIRSYHSTKLHAWFELGNKLNSAPAPEVQGTPAKKPWIWAAKSIARVTGTPVGTPQKETPPMKITCKDHDVLDCAICYPTSVSFRACPTCGCEKYHGPGVNCVPEGVQGKEPQAPTTLSEFIEYSQLHTLTFDNEDEAADLMTATWIAAHAAGKVSGEAAGRRSAITPEQVEKMREDCHATYNGGHHDTIPREAFHHGMDTVFNVLKARAERECAELQEKP